MNTSITKETQQALQLMNIEDYFAIVKRRKLAFIIPFL